MAMLVNTGGKLFSPKASTRVTGNSGPFFLPLFLCMCRFKSMSMLNVRTQILLTKEQMNYLAKLKKQTGESIGTLIRRWIDEQRTKDQKKT